MRRALHFAVVGVLLLAFGQAPFEHTHEGDEHHEHASAMPHAHLLKAATDGLAWDDVDVEGGARLEDWVTESGTTFAKLAPMLPMGTLTIRLASRTLRRTEHRLRNHDPPALVFPSLRGPPPTFL